MMFPLFLALITISLITVIETATYTIMDTVKGKHANSEIRETKSGSELMLSWRFPDQNQRQRHNLNQMLEPWPKSELEP